MKTTIIRLLALIVVVAVALSTASCRTILSKVDPKPTPRPQDGIMLAMVALKQSLPPSAEKILNYLSKTWDDVPPMFDVARKDDGAVTFSTPDGTGLIGFMPFPIPWGDLEGPCETAWYWPEACDELRDHKAHVVVGIIQKSSADPVASALLLTKLAASVAANSDSVGVYWGSGTVVQPAEDFVGESKSMSSDHLPLMLWIDFRLEQQDGGSSRAFTTGMEAFGLMEIEAESVRKDADYVFGKFYDIAHYLLENGPVIKDGDTIGESSTERIRVRHRPSMFNESKKVYKLTFPK